MQLRIITTSQIENLMSGLEEGNKEPRPASHRKDRFPCILNDARFYLLRFTRFILSGTHQSTILASVKGHPSKLKILHFYSPLDSSPPPMIFVEASVDKSLIHELR